MDKFILTLMTNFPVLQFLRDEEGLVLVRTTSRHDEVKFRRKLQLLTDSTPYKPIWLVPEPPSTTKSQPETNPFLPLPSPPIQPPNATQVHNDETINPDAPDDTTPSTDEQARQQESTNPDAPAPAPPPQPAAMEPVTQPKPTLQQCYSCLLWGHLAANCSNATRCNRCSGPHNHRTCTQDRATPKCGNCGGKHQASHRLCPVRPRATRTTRTKAGAHQTQPLPAQDNPRGGRPAPRLKPERPCPAPRDTNRPPNLWGGGLPTHQNMWPQFDARLNPNAAYIHMLHMALLQSQPWDQTTAWRPSKRRSRQPARH